MGGGAVCGFEEFLLVFKISGIWNFIFIWRYIYIYISIQANYNPPTA